MIRNFTKLVAAISAAAVITTGVSVDTSAANLAVSLPVAGIAKALKEDKILEVLEAEEEMTEDGQVVLSAGAERELSDYDYKSSTIKETASTTDPALITVGAASANTNETISENLVLEESANLEDDSEEETDEAVSDNEALETEADESQEGEYVEDSTEDAMEELYVLTGLKTEKPKDEEFDNLVIAQVNDYVNVRAEASEDSEIVGKLYNNSVGDLLGEEGDWYKIKSGNCTGYVKGEYVATGEDAQKLAKEVGTRMAVVTTTTLYVREEPSTDASVLGMVPIEDELIVTDELDGWVKVSVEEGDGYVSAEFVDLYTEFVRAESKEEEKARLEKEEAERKAAREAARRAEEKNRAKSNKGSAAGSAPAPVYSAAGSGTGSSVASYALQFVGNPYVYGGSSLTNGTDCSGFVMSVYRNFGVSLPHSSGGDRGVGYDVGGLGNAQAGDIVCYSGHVGIYIGGGKIVHASTPATGIKVSDANYRRILAVRRVF